MVNAWSLLFDELNMSNQDFWKEDGFSLTGNPGTASSDTISFSNDFRLNLTGVIGAEGEDRISLGETTLGKKVNPTFRKYNEDEIIKELSDYITRTYSSHYSAGSDKIQTLDLIEACGDGESFCRSNILKYASRYDKKGTARRDIMKILHYAVLLMFFNDKNNKTETYNQ